MHDTEVKPPPGGNVVSGGLHPGTGVTGDGEVVGTAETAGWWEWSRSPRRGWPSRGLGSSDGG